MNTPRIDTCEGCGRPAVGFMVCAKGHDVPGGYWHEACIDLAKFREDWRAFVTRWKLPEEDYWKPFDEMTTNLKVTRRKAAA